MAPASTSLPHEFAEMERRLEMLRGHRAQGRLSPQDFQARVLELTLQDASGQNWWLGSDPGAWHRWDGQRWVRANPPPASFIRSVRAAGSQAQRRRRAIIGAGCGAAVVAAMALVGGLLWVGYQDYRTSPKIVEDIQITATPAGRLPLSGEQQQVRSERGAPQAFMILFYDEELEDGSTGAVRLETWTYYTDSLEYTFINGELVGEDAIEVDIGDLAGIPYTPEQFQAYMDLEGVLASAGLEAYLVVPLERELVQDGEVYYADRLTFGLKKGELRYVEALALEVEG